MQCRPSNGQSKTHHVETHNHTVRLLHQHTPVYVDTTAVYTPGDTFESVQCTDQAHTTQSNKCRTRGSIMLKRETHRRYAAPAYNAKHLPRARHERTSHSLVLHKTDVTGTCKGTCTLESNTPASISRPMDAASTRHNCCMQLPSTARGSTSPQSTSTSSHLPSWPR